jgi:hypothetical protein
VRCYRAVPKRHRCYSAVPKRHRCYSAVPYPKKQVFVFVFVFVICYLLFVICYCIHFTHTCRLGRQRLTKTLLGFTYSGFMVPCQYGTIQPIRVFIVPCQNGTGSQGKYWCLESVLHNQGVYRKLCGIETTTPHTCRLVGSPNTY